MADEVNTAPECIHSFTYTAGHYDENLHIYTYVQRCADCGKLLFQSETALGEAPQPPLTSDKCPHRNTYTASDYDVDLQAVVYGQVCLDCGTILFEKKPEENKPHEAP